MKLKNITSIVIIAITATLLTGCQDQLKKDLTDCRQENTKLQSTLNTQQEEIAKYKKIEEAYGFTLMKAMMENEKLKAEIAKLKAAKPAQKKEMTPEQRERMRKGIEELRKLQKESAEKMRLERLKKEGKK